MRSTRLIFPAALGFLAVVAIACGSGNAKNDSNNLDNQNSEYTMRRTAVTTSSDGTENEMCIGFFCVTL